MIPGYLSPLLNHLWQSTLFAAVVGVLALTLRRNRAAVRYVLWLAASVKFLVPWSWLVSLGSYFGWRAAPAFVSASFVGAMEQVFVPPTFQSAAPAVTPATVSLPELLFGVWILGVAAVLFSWWRQWRSIRAALSRATPLQGKASNVTTEIAIMSSPDLLEPGIVGIRRPVLLMPDGIADRLTPSQLQAVVAHELCHVRRRDNLAAAVHMVVEALYWFHPVVWWLERRLVDERERACDEDVVRRGSDPREYSEGILTVCKLYAESPLICSPGVTGSNLKARIEAIMTSDGGRDLNSWKRLLLATAAVVAVVAPVVAGALNAPPRAAQSRGNGAESRNLAFEVASVKPNTSRDGERSADLTTGRFSMTYASLRDLVTFAYQRQDGNLRLDSQISGGPGWINSDRFDVVAKVEGMPRGLDASATAAGAATSSELGAVDRVRLMMRALLADRFKLTVHNELRELPVYVLSIAGTRASLGPQLRRVDIDCAALREAGLKPAPGPSGSGCGGFGGLGPGHSVGHAVPISMIAGLLEGTVGRNVFDRTGLAGTFDVDLHWTPDQQGRADADASPVDLNGPSIFTAVREQLGLKLDSTRGQVDVLIIDSVERPTAN